MANQLSTSAGATLYQALETTFNTIATTGWSQLQPNPGGIQAFNMNAKKVARNPLSKSRQLEKGDIVDGDASPKIVHDLTKDFLDRFSVPTFLSLEKFSGGTGTGRFYPSAVTTSQFTVAGGGALQAGTLLYARGFINPANNGVFVVGASSTATSIKVTGLVAETPPLNATVEVVGFQGTASDITSSATGLGSTTLDFRTLGLTLNQWVWVGGGTAAAPGGNGFGTSTNRGFGRVTNNTLANSLPLDRLSQVWSTDTGTGKTIQIFFGSFLRNVAIDHADYLNPQSGLSTFDLVLALAGLDTTNATDYLSYTGGVVDSLEINAPGQDKIVATLNSMGCQVSDPSVVVPTGIASALVPVAQAALNTVTELARLRVFDTLGNAVSVDIDTWKLTIMNHMKAQKQQGTFGPKRMLPGQIEVDFDLTAFATQPDLMKAMTSNITLAVDVGLRNADGGVLFDIPAATVDPAAPAFAENDAVTIATKINAFRDPTYSYTLGLSKFPFLPSS